MSQIQIPYTPRPIQLEMHNNIKRWNVLVIHRRFGKTVWAINQLLKDCITKPISNPRYGYLAPLLKQAKDIAWDYLQYYSRPIPGIVVNQSELRIDYPNGGRIRLYGCDNPDAMRGVYFDGVVMDEYAQMPPNVISEIIRPALSDRQGYAVFMGTPKGKNTFYELYQKALQNPDWYVKLARADETNILPLAELEDAKMLMAKEEFAQEYLCDWAASIRGAYFSDELTEAREQKRVGKVPHDPAVLVDTWWDLGMDDSTAIWFTQNAGREIHVVDYYESSDHGLMHYRDKLEELKKERKYRYGQHTGPHDLAVRELGTGRSRLEVARDMGLYFEAAKKPKQKADAISAARKMIGVCWFDETRCQVGINALENYRKEWDAKNNVYREKPLHDQYSHAADAFMTLAMAHRFRERRSGNVTFINAAGWT
jgi:hypothetical protein